MAYKTIFTVLNDPEEVSASLDAVLPLVEAEGAHLEILCLKIDRMHTGYYFAGATALMHEDSLAHHQADLKTIESKAREALADSNVSWGIDSMVAQSGAMSDLVARRARFSDLVVLPQPYGTGRSADAPLILEAAMFQGQAPALVLPAGQKASARPKRAVIAWNQSAEALSAVGKALPLLIAADEVKILIIDPPQNGPETADPGADLSRKLSRHGAKVEVTIQARTLPRVSEVIERFVAEQGADLLVMGAYGHSRFREAILGGATRNLLEMASVPVLMAH